MALKAEAPLLDYLKVSLKQKTEKEKEGRKDPLLTVRAPGRSDETGGRAERLLPDPAAHKATHEEPGSSWSQEYLVAENSEHGRPVCMVCGAILRAPGPAEARKHILQQHAHSLGFSVEEKRNILEAWSEGAVLPKKELPPSLAGPSAASPGKGKRPAEIEVLLDSEEQTASRKRGRLKGRCEGLRSDPVHHLQPHPRQNSLSSVKDPRPKTLTKTTGKEWLSDCGVPGSAPAEIRIFTDGTFPAGFALKLYCHSQPEPPENSGAKGNAGGKPLGRKCSVSLLRLNDKDSAQLCPPGALASRPGSRAKDCAAAAAATRPRQPSAPATQEDLSLLAKGFDPAWRARFLMDFDNAAGHLVCMVCEYPLRRVCLDTVKRHILQCHAETLHLPREVRRTIREVWESRAQTSTPPARK